MKFRIIAGIILVIILIAIGVFLSGNMHDSNTPSNIGSDRNTDTLKNLKIN